MQRLHIFKILFVLLLFIWVIDVLELFLSIKPEIWWSLPSLRLSVLRYNRTDKSYSRPLKHNPTGVRIGQVFLNQSENSYVVGPEYTRHTHESGSEYSILSRASLRGTARPERHVHTVPYDSADSVLGTSRWSLRYSDRWRERVGFWRNDQCE